MDHEVSCLDIEDISESFAAAIGKATDRVFDRIVLSVDQADALLGCFNELWDEVTESSRSRPNPRWRPLFFLLKNINDSVYLSPRAIALVTQDHSGNANVVTVNGSILGIEALQWAMMRDLFHEAIDLKVVQSTSGIVKDAGRGRRRRL
jgi:hypothetical protein